MKYIDEDILRAKITDLCTNANYYQQKAMEESNKEDFVSSGGEIFAYAKVLSFVDSLQQEQPDNEDIDKVAQELYEHLYELKRRNNVPTNLYDKQEIIDLWKAGIEYGRNHPKQEQPEVDLEKVIEQTYHDGSVADTSDMDHVDYENIARHFYELARQKYEK